MKLITGLILTLVFLFTGCQKTDAPPPEALYTPMFYREGSTRSPGVFSVGAEEFYTEVSVSDTRPQQVVFTSYTPDGNPASETSFPLPEDARQIPHACLGERGVYLIHKGGFDSDPYYFSLYDREGNLLQSIPLASVRPEMVTSHYPNEDLRHFQYNLPMTETDDGIAMLWGNYILFLKEDLTVDTTLKLPTSKAALYNDNGLKLVYNDNGKGLLADVTGDGLKITAKLPDRFLSGSILTVRNGIVYGHDSIGVYRWNTDGSTGDTPEEFCTLTPSGINGKQVRKIHLIFRENEEYPDLHIFHDTASDYRYTWMTRDTSVTLGDRITVTVAVPENDRNLAQHIIDFNQSQSEIRVVLIDYSVYNSSDNPDGAWTKMKIDLSTGLFKPDIIAAFSTYTREFLAMDGYFTDLTALMEEYPSCGITEENVWNSVLTAYSHDGKLLALPKSIRLRTVVGLTEYLPGQRWNLEEFLNYADSLPDGAHLTDAMSRSSLYDLLGGFQYDTFTARKNFDDPLYLRYLNTIAPLPLTAPSLTEHQTAYDPLINETVTVTADPYAIYRDGTARLSAAALLGPGSYLEILTQFGVSDPDALTFIGYPTDHEGGNTVNSPECVYMIPEHCVNREEAWTFVTSVIRSQTEAVTSGGRSSRTGIGILRNETIAYLNTLRVYEITDKAGNVTGVQLAAEGENEQTALTEAVREGFVRLYDSPAYPDYFLRTPFDLEEIITEEEAAFLTGGADLESAVKAIRSRTGIYFAERE